MKTLRLVYLSATMFAMTATLQACGGGDSGASSMLSAKAQSTPTSQDAAAGQQVAHAAQAARWTPVASDTWQWQLTGKINTSYNVKIYDVDLFDTDAATLAALKKAGRKVVCYFSAGSAENWRPDYGQFKAADKGKPLDGWVGETWLDVRSSNVRQIMTARLDRAVQKGCDGVEPDNVDGYSNDSGFNLTPKNQIDYNSFIANEAHKRNLAVGLKNDVEQLDALQPLFDFAVNESCNAEQECPGYRVFTQLNKPVLNAEYAAVYRTAAGQKKLCAASKAANIRTLVLAKKLDDSYRFSCD